MRGDIRRRRYDTSTARSLGILRRAVASWLGIFLVAFNLAAAGALPIRPSDAVLFAEGRIQLCTADGMVVVDANGQPVQHGGEHGALCAFCLPLLHGNVEAPMTTVAGDTAPRWANVRPVLAGELSLPPPARFATSAFPRAPPSLLPS